MSDLACLLPYYHTFNIISTPICFTFYHAQLRPGNQEKGDFGHFQNLDADIFVFYTFHVQS